MNYLTTEDGKPIRRDNPLDVKISGDSAVQISGSNTEETNGANIATKSNLVAGKSPTGKQRPLSVDEDGKLQVGGITVESLIATTVGIDQTTPGTTNKVVAELSGSKMELYGVAIEDRPDANTVAVGATFTIVDDTGNFDSYISNGTDWLEV